MRGTFCGLETKFKIRNTGVFSLQPTEGKVNTNLKTCHPFTRKIPKKFFHELKIISLKRVIYYVTFLAHSLQLFSQKIARVNQSARFQRDIAVRFVKNPASLHQVSKMSENPAISH